MDRTERELARAEKIERQLKQLTETWAERNGLPQAPKTETQTPRPHGAPMIRG